MNDMKIKKGDMVRVSKDTPKLYTEGWSCNWLDCDLCVRQIDGDAAEVARINDNDEWFYLSIPCKYLVKVEAEAKEPKLKKGDKVKYVGKEHPEYWDEVFTVDGEIFYNDYHKNMQIDSVRCEKYNLCNVPLSDLVLYTEPTAPSIKVGDRVRCKNPIRLANSTDNDFIGTATDAENGWFIVHMNNGAIFQTYHESDLELVQPKEQAEVEKNSYDGISEETANEISNALEAYSKAMSDIADSFDWQRYEADLAKEVAVMLVRTHRNDLNKVAKMSVDIAKAVVEGLKRK